MIIYSKCFLFFTSNRQIHLIDGNLRHHLVLQERKEHLLNEVDKEKDQILRIINMLLPQSHFFLLTVMQAITMRM